MRRIIISLLTITFLTVATPSCATWSAKTATEKYQAAVVYYQTFSAGLHATAAFLPPTYAAQAGAALGVLDGAVAMLSSLLAARATSEELERASAQAAVAVQAANAVVASSPGPVTP